jgi:signal transduction histidine kinase
VQQRFRLTYFLLLASALLLGMIPLAQNIAARATAGVFFDRAADAGRLATLSYGVLLSEDTGRFTQDVARYSELYGSQVFLVSRDGAVLIGGELPPGLSATVSAALAGNTPSVPDTVWPWARRSLVVAEPVVNNGELLGALVTLTATDGLRGTVTYRWLLLLAGSLVGLVLADVIARGLGRWVTRPVKDLGTAVSVMSTGDFSVRVGHATGPPELRSLALAFDRMADAVGRLHVRQRLLVSFAGHQVRNPLAAVRLQVENLREDPSGDLVRRCDGVLDEMDRLARVCDLLVSLGRADLQDVECARVDVAGVLRRRTEVWTPVAAARRVHLDVLWPPSAVRVLAVETALDQILDALVDNALKYVRSGDSVRVHARPAGLRAVHVVVEDTGPGMSRSALSTALTPYWRRSDQGGPPGSGLGLSIADMLAQQSGGTLELEARQPHGLRAVVTLAAA